MYSDLCYALRRLGRTPGFTLIATFTLALGIGAATALFSALRALVLDPLPYERPAQLVQVWSGPSWPLSTPDFLVLHEQAQSFSAFGAYVPGSANIGGGDRPQNVPTVACTEGVLRAFGVRPQRGRWFEPADEQPGAAPVAVIAHSLWRDTFACDPGLVGQPIRIDGRAATVVGIMPASFEFAAPWRRGVDIQLWTPLRLDSRQSERGSHGLCALARLEEGITPGAADAELKAVGRRLAAAYPETNTGKPFLVATLHEEMAGPMRLYTWMLFAAVLLVQLVACVNVASMLLARGALRQTELGLRTAIGARRSDILRLVLCESFLLATGAMLLGLLVASGAVELVAATVPASEARKAAIALGAPEFVFVAALGLLATLLAGLPTAFAATSAKVADLIRSDNRTASGSRARHRLLRGLVVAQVVVAFLLVNGAVLLTTSYRNLRAANRTLATDQVVAAELALRGDRYADTEGRSRFCERLVEATWALPGVVAVGTTSKLPLEGGSNTSVLANDEVFDPALKRPLVEVSSITPGYFEAANIRLLRGRKLRPGDDFGDRLAVVVNRAFAEKYWPGQDPIGRIFRQNGSTPQWTASVVGVVEDVRQWGAGTEAQPELYWGPRRAWNRQTVLVVRSAQPAAVLAEPLQETIASLDPELPLARVRTFVRIVDDATAGERPVIWYVNAFMVLALLLVAIGLYGTLSYVTRERTREIGIRLALGANPRDIGRSVAGQGLRWALLGSALGIAGAFATAALLRSALYGVGAISVPALLASVGLACGVSVAACWWPARRASRVDPLVALRSE